MKREFLERVGVRQNARVGVVLGLLVGLGGAYMAYTARDVLLFPFPLYLGLAAVAVAVTAMFTMMALTLGRWALLARRGDLDAGQETEEPSSGEDAAGEDDGGKGGQR